MIACALLLGILYICILSGVRVKQTRAEVFAYIDSIDYLLAENRPEDMNRQVEELCEYWASLDQDIGHYVRHSHIDDISRGMARLPALARHEDFSEFSSELSLIRWQLDHIWEAEKPYWRNIL